MLLQVAAHLLDGHQHRRQLDGADARGQVRGKLGRQAVRRLGQVMTGIRDDASTLYCLTGSVKDAAKVAALKVYVTVRTKALLWQNQHPDEYAKAYLEAVQGLSAADAKAVNALDGTTGIPATWDNAQTRLQETADLLSTEQGHKKLDVSTLVDRRFEKIEAAAAGPDVVTGDAS